MPGAAAATGTDCAAEAPFAPCTVTFTEPPGDSSLGTSTLICPPAAESAKIGTAVPLNSTLTLLKVVAGNADRLSLLPKFAPKTDVMEPGATGFPALKLALFTTDAIAGPWPTGSRTEFVFTPLMVPTTGCMPGVVANGTVKAIEIRP